MWEPLASVLQQTAFINQNLTFLSQVRKMRFWGAIVGGRGSKTGKHVVKVISEELKSKNMI